MPQSERSQMIKQMLAWIHGNPRGVNYYAAIKYVKVNISEMGARSKTIKSWIDDCLKVGLLSLSGNTLKTTEAYKNWLQKGL